MATRRFVALYTKQKTQKTKKWLDGFLEVRGQMNKIILLDEKGSVLDSQFLKPGGEVGSGSDLEFPTFLVTVEEETPTPLPTPTIAPAPSRSWGGAGGAGSIGTSRRRSWNGKRNKNEEEEEEEATEDHRLAFRQPIISPAFVSSRVAPTPGSLVHNKESPPLPSRSARSVEDVLSILLGEVEETGEEEEEVFDRMVEEREGMQEDDIRFQNWQDRGMGRGTVQPKTTRITPVRRRVGLAGGGVRRSLPIHPKPSTFSPPTPSIQTTSSTRRDHFTPTLSPNPFTRNRRDDEEEGGEDKESSRYRLSLTQRLAAIEKSREVVKKHEEEKDGPIESWEVPAISRPKPPTIRALHSNNDHIAGLTLEDDDGFFAGIEDESFCYSTPTTLTPLERPPISVPTKESRPGAPAYKTNSPSSHPSIAPANTKTPWKPPAAMKGRQPVAPQKQGRIDMWLHKRAATEADEEFEEDSILSTLAGISDGNSTVSKVVQSEKRRRLLYGEKNGLSNPSRTVPTGNIGEVFTKGRLTEWSSFLLFPGDKMSNNLIEKLGTPPQRTKTIPNRFTDLQTYRFSFVDAILEELQLELLQLAIRFRACCNSIFGDEAPNPVICPHGPARLVPVKKEGKTQGRLFYTCPAPRSQGCKAFKWADEVPNKDGKKGVVPPNSVVKTPNKFDITKADEAIFRSRGAPVYTSCDLIRSNKEKHQKGNNSSSSSSSASEAKLFIKLSSKESLSVYAKDDLWIISNTPRFEVGCKGQFVFLARSRFHQPGQSLLLEIAPLNPKDKNQLSQEGVYAIRGPNISMHYASIENLLKLGPTHPLLPTVLQPMESTVLSPTPALSSANRREVLQENKELVDKVVEDIIVEYKLNSDQATVLSRFVAQLSESPPDSCDNVLLVHGVFGSGKSTLLVVLIICLSRIMNKIRDEKGEDKMPDLRCLVSSATNTAVDRILVGLLDKDFLDFIRVGSVRRIAKPVLRYTLVRVEKGHGSTDKEEAPNVEEALRDLKGMLVTEKLSASEKKDVLSMMDELKSGRMAQRMKRLNESRVVGVTCASSVFSILEGSQFPIVILDECSQMIEPLSMLPIGKFSSEHLIAVGDPLQLPPQLSSVMKSNHAPEGLEKTLFTRLAKCGIEPILLRTQYRCHPAFSKLANSLFYGGKLLDGIKETDRSPVVDALSPLMLIDCPRGTERSDAFGSWLNEFESKVVVHLLQILIGKHGVEGKHIGVITLYKAQAAHLSTTFHQLQTAKQKSISAASPKKVKAGEQKKKSSKRKRKNSGKKKISEDDDIFLVDEGEEAEEEEEEKEVEDEEEVEGSGREVVELVDEEWRFLQAMSDVQISTVDAFQGAEKEVIILVTSRTSGLGFIDSPNRMTVALTRAKRHLVIVGKKQVLESNTMWNAIVKECLVQRQGLFSGDSFLLRGDFE